MAPPLPFTRRRHACTRACTHARTHALHSGAHEHMHAFTCACACARTHKQDIATASCAYFQHQLEHDQLLRHMLCHLVVVVSVISSTLVITGHSDGRAARRLKCVRHTHAPCMHTCKHSCAVYARTHARACMHARTYQSTPHTRVCTHTAMHAHTHARTHACLHAHARYGHTGTADIVMAYIVMATQVRRRPARGGL